MNSRANFNPWKRTFHPEYQHSAEDKDYFLHRAHKKPKFFQNNPTNIFLDIDTKIAALKASPSVVALASYSGKKELSQGCGTIIEVDEDNMAIVITSANLIRRPTEADVGENVVADNLKVFVHAYDEKSYKGEIYGFDFHYNLLAIKFKSETSLPAASYENLMMVKA